MSSRLSLKEMADWCRSLGSSLHAGLPILDAFRIAGRRSNSRTRQISKEVCRDIKNGADLTQALQNRGQIFPPLFMAMAHVAGQTGHLPEVLRRLEDYFRFQLRLRRQFLQQIFWPFIQLFAAIGIIALLIFILGILSDTPGGSAVKILGLSGPQGAFIWLMGWAFFFSFFIGGYFFTKKVLHLNVVDKILLRVPVLGPCLEALALSRFCFAFSITGNTSMSILEAIPISLEATDNGAYVDLKEPIVERIKYGESLDVAFSATRAFPEEFLEVLSTAEQSGRVPEAMERLSEQYNETAEHRLALLNTAVGWCVWALVAGIIIFMIFQIFITAYLAPMNEALKMMQP